MGSNSKEQNEKYITLIYSRLHEQIGLPVRSDKHF